MRDMPFDAKATLTLVALAAVAMWSWLCGAFG
jgi:hypothetical protein